MIALPFDRTLLDRSADAARARGLAAEEQLAHFLGRAFSESPDILVFHGLRFPAPRSASEDDHPQIDHLVLHRHGMVLIESKATGDDRGVFHVDSHDQWVRCPGGDTRRGFNMNSPLEQARRQAEALRVMLQRADPPLLDKIGGVLQAGFACFPVLTIVAIANNARIEGPGVKAHEGRVMKAEKVVERIRAEVDWHGRRTGVLGLIRGALDTSELLSTDRGLFNLSDTARTRIKDYLLKVHAPLPSALAATVAVPTPRPAPAQLPRPTDVRPEALTCRHCRSINVQPVYRKDYCLLCEECGKYTPLSRTCTNCGNPNATIHKRGGEFYRACDVTKRGCGAEVVFWAGK